MKINLIIPFFFIIVSACSFDKKTGIWDGAEILNEQLSKKEIKEKKFESVFNVDKSYQKVKQVDPKSLVKIKVPTKNNSWSQENFNNKNNISNIFFNNNQKLIFKSQRLSKSLDFKSIYYFKKNIVSHDHRGTIFVYSIQSKKKILEYNFYKKKFKKFKKKIYLIVKDDVIYAADNLGYIYSIDINNNKVIWAKNFGIPFRSNIKIVNDTLILANQDNVIFSIDKYTGEKKWEFSSSFTFLKTNFENSFLIDEKNNLLFFLNTSGELYSINYLTRKINWVLNFKNSSTSGSELFKGLPLVLEDNNLVVHTGNTIFNYDIFSGEKKWSKNIPINTKTVLSRTHVFLISKSNFLICLDLVSGKFIWSKNVDEQIKIFNKKKLISKIGSLKNLLIVDNKIFLFSEKGFLLIFNLKNGNIVDVYKISKKGILSKPIFADGFMFVLNKNNKLLKFN
tara:strand:- start:2338 stop:3690 length:1353 start_codon:yes stop_codon:yes gene_type:complete